MDFACGMERDDSSVNFCLFRSMYVVRECDGKDENKSFSYLFISIVSSYSYAWHNSNASTS